MNAKKTAYISGFYYFKTLNDLDPLKNILEVRAKELGVRGLAIMASEGINATISCLYLENLKLFEDFLRQTLEIPDLTFKHSQSPNGHPFRRFKIKFRSEIVTLNTPELKPQGECHHLTPEEWNRVLKEEKDFLLIDTRNWYETQMGKFKGALDPKIKVFTDFPKYLETNEIPKDKKILIYCTGGIRCEKGLLQMQQSGYENVYQLKGGILKYLEEYPNDQFDGECFVFDHRVALDQNLNPTQKAKLCPHTGQPANHPINCVRCDSPALIDKENLDDPIKSQTCSKNCAQQWKLRPGKKGKPQLMMNAQAL
ncbi:MAG: hypothetical protein H6625_10745 [Bdellovibrionaceae bacterium]|nr:hypothetical protein [Pseudobdellovibrionaceae bacterium]